MITTEQLKPHLQQALRDHPTPELPLPRLQLTWLKITPKVGADADKWYCSYDLILPLGEHDCRKLEGLTLLPVNLGYTQVGMSQEGTPKLGDGTLTTPYRDGVHIKWDSEVLKGLPMYVVWEDIVQIIEQEK